MIGVFDSGYGGLTVLNELIRRNPEYNYIYLGDNKRVPYGNKTNKEIYNATCQAVDFLYKKKCKVIIIACNTVSSRALREIQQKYVVNNRYKIKILGVLVPAVERVEELYKTNNIKRVGIIATRATVKLGEYKRKIENINKNLKIFQVGCPLLVPIIELSGKRELLIKQLRRYINKIKKNKVDTLIIGCTHYNFLEKEIKKIFGNRVINTSIETGRRLKIYLKNHREIKLKKNKQRHFYTTGDNKKFEKFYYNKFNKNIKAKPIRLD